MRSSFVRMDGLLVERRIFDARISCPPTQGKYAECCHNSEVVVSRKEAKRIVDLLGEIRKFHGQIFQRGKYVNFFDEVHEDEIRIDSEDFDTCPLLHRNSKGDERCSLHTACNRLGLPVPDYKPMACRMWPLTVEIARGGNLQITVGVRKEGACCVRFSGKTGSPLLVAMEPVLTEFLGGRITGQLLGLQKKLKG
jgi:hypothetical protein